MAEKVAEGKFVEVKVSAMKGKKGKVVAIGKNPALPIAVEFEGSETQWDYLESELKVVPEDGYHQLIMDGAYDKWQKQGDGRSEAMEDWFERLTDLEKDAVAIGKFNQQVCNGGFAQWVGNGYMEVQFKRLQQALLRLPECEVVGTVKEILGKFEEIAERNEWGAGSYSETEYEDCCECGGSGYIEGDNGEEISCDNCDDGQYEYEDELCEELQSAGLDDEYYEVNEEFLKVCEAQFKSIVEDGNDLDYAPKKVAPIRIEKPKVKLSGTDGNVFAIIGTVMNALKKANWTQAERDAVMEDMKKGDYNHVLQVAMKVCEVN